MWICGRIDSSSIIAHPIYTTGTIAKIRCQEVDISIIDRYNSFDNRYGFFCIERQHYTLVGSKIVDHSDRRCSNYIFILDLTSGFKGFYNDSRKTVGESFKCWDLVPLILETWRYIQLLGMIREQSGCDDGISPEMWSVMCSHYTHEEGFEIPMPSQCSEIIENTSPYISMLPWKILNEKG